MEAKLPQTCFQEPQLFLVNLALFQKTLHQADVPELAPGSAQQAATLLASAVPGRALEDAPVRAQRVAPMTALGHAPARAGALAQELARVPALSRAPMTAPAPAQGPVLAVVPAPVQAPVRRRVLMTAGEVVLAVAQVHALEHA